MRKSMVGVFLCGLIATACGTTVDVFNVQGWVVGDSLRLVLETDLPDEMVLDVGMGRMYITKGEVLAHSVRPQNLFFAEVTVAELRKGVVIDLIEENEDFYPFVIRRIGFNPDWYSVEITDRHYAYIALPPGETEGWKGEAVTPIPGGGDSVKGQRVYGRYEFRWGRSFMVKEE